MKKLSEPFQRLLFLFTLLTISSFLISCNTTTTTEGNNYDLETQPTKYSEETEAPTKTAVNNTTEETKTQPENITEGLAEMQVHFIDVGQGDSTLIICGTEAMLIDAGNNNQGTRVQNYLQKQGVKTLKYVICTHPDTDHIGGMDVILYKFDCETIFMTDEERDNNTYRDVIDTMKNKGYKNTLPLIGNEYSLGDAQFTILAPGQMSENSNNNSIAVILTHGNNSFLFTGDAEEKEEYDIINCGISVDADVYKAGHHGSNTSSSKELLKTVSPAFAVISCAEGNSYGHPHAETLNNLRNMNVQVFRTDEQGSIIATSDGINIKWNCSPSGTWKAGENTQNSENIGVSETGTDVSKNETNTESAVAELPSETLNTITYICNTNTGKFHYTYCSSVGQMSDKNKLAVTVTRDELIRQGYVPCKKCNP